MPGVLWPGDSQGGGSHGFEVYQTKRSIKTLLSIFFGEGSALNTVLVGKRNCTTTTLLAPVFSMKL